MIAAAAASGDALDADRQIPIALRDQAGQPVDLLGSFRRRLDFNPAADAVEDGFGIERVGGGCCRHAVAYIEIPTLSFRSARQREPGILRRTSLGSGFATFVAPRRQARRACEGNDT